MTTYAIWYMRPEWFARGVTGEKLPNPDRLRDTHVHLIDYVPRPSPHPLETIFCELQGEVWSPNGEARDMIRSKGLAHTSMSVGDVIVDPDGVVHVVKMMGFAKLERKKAHV